ncbi:MAG: hypothetical protein JJ964_16195 [Rhizobiales bacterium]|nr:hypothetical protein [Hyphomicrobiales bacterium]
MLSFMSVRSVRAAENNPYPTVVIADYIFGCMASNGQTRQALERCSCSIDIISSIVSYANYERAETVLSLRRLTGEKSALYKTAAQYKNAVDILRRAQAEAEVRCF